MAKGYARFNIFGRVGSVKEIGSVLKVSIAAEYGSKNKAGDFESNPFWNTVTVFEDGQIAWAKNNLSVGDLVIAEGTIRETSWEDKNGDTQYGVTLGGSITRVAKAKEASSD